jgi:radical SAM protein with 4Fe4S-binding SPASM domain
MGYFSYELERKCLEKRIPNTAYIEVTYRCNQSCSICYNGLYEGELTTAEIIQILDELALSGCLFLTITGGEPFLRSDIFEILTYAVDIGFAVTLKTNGTLIDNSIAEKLKDLHLFEVNISLFSASAESHDSVTGADGSFDKAVNAIKLLKTRGINVKVMSVIINGNTGEMADIEGLCSSLEVEPVFDSFISPGNGTEKEAVDYRLSDDELKEFYFNLKKDSLPDCKKMEAELTDEERENDLLLTCGAGRNTVSITPTGKVTPCVTFPVVIGDIKKDSLRDILDSSETDSFIESIRIGNNKKCYECGDRLICFRCPGFSYNETGRADQAPEEGCRQMKIKRDVIK